jgi:hypothetical protein
MRDYVLELARLLQTLEGKKKVVKECSGRGGRGRNG